MIIFQDVYKQYPQDEGDPVQDFSGFSEQIEDGEFVLITGESGSGKSTLLKLLLKETEADRGTIVVDGKRLSDIDPGQIPYYRRGIGVIFLDFRLFEE